MPVSVPRTVQIFYPATISCKRLWGWGSLIVSPALSGAVFLVLNPFLHTGETEELLHIPPLRMADSIMVMMLQGKGN